MHDFLDGMVCRRVPRRLGKVGCPPRRERLFGLRPACAPLRPYGYVHPHAELYAGVGMTVPIGTGRAPIWLTAPLGISIGAIGIIKRFMLVIES